MKQQGYYRNPTIHDNHIIFVSEDDLWSVSLDNSRAFRLTSNLGEVSYPSLSPDGKWLAFIGREDGNAEVYVMPANGGTATRLTFQGSMAKIANWQGDDIIYTSSYGSAQRGHMELFRINRKGGYPKKLPWGLAHNISFGENGGVVLGRNTADPARWKRYRGGTAGEIWIDTSGSGKFRRLLSLKGNLAAPMWVNGRIYFISDHEGMGNIYSCGLTGKGLKQHCKQKEYFVRNAGTDGKKIVYHSGGDLFIYDPEKDETRKVEIDYTSPRIQTSRKFVSAKQGFQDYNLNADSSLISLNVRGKSMVMGPWDGPVFQQGDRQGVRYQHINFHKDGKSVVLISDKGGTEQIEIHSIKGAKAPVVLSGLNIGRPMELKSAPTENLAAIVNHRNEILQVDLEKKKVLKIDKSKYHTINSFSWSGDSRYISYSCSVTPRSTVIKVYDRKTKKIHQITDSVSHDYAAVFDPTGKYLYLLSKRVFNPVYDDIQFELGFPRGSQPFVVTLAKDTPSPFIKEAESYTKAPKPENDKKKKDDKKPEVLEVKIDFEGIQDRILSFPVSEGLYSNIGAVKGKVFYTVSQVEGSRRAPWYDLVPAAKNTLKVFDFEEQKEKTFLSSVTDFKISSKGDTILIRTGNSLKLHSTKDAPTKNGNNGNSSKKSGRIDLGRIKAAIEPLREWQQIYAEAWRLQRDYFWVENMGGIDWKKVYMRYFPLIERVSSRSEFSDIMWEMQGELGTSHAYEMGGDYRASRPYNTGYLGIDLKYNNKSKAFIIDNIVKGDTWESELSPFLRPGLNVQPGAEIRAVNGEKVSAKNPPEKYLVNNAGSEIRLTIKDKGKRNTREIHLKTLKDEGMYRYRDWVEANRSYVHKKSRGKAGYLHIPDMGPDGFAEFHRYFLQEIEYDALVVDVRHNGGGHVSQLLLRKLAQKRLGYDLTRWMGKEPYPSEAPAGPMVALTNEYAGSDGDIFSHSFKMMKLGKLIGLRTWGGVIGIWPRNSLVDGTITTQPEFSFWFHDVGWNVENYGTDVDIEVIITPQDYAAGKDPQLDRGIEEVLRDLKRNPLEKPNFKDKPSIKLPS